MSREELEKLTSTKLKEVAKEYPDIVGATGMKKEELVIAILKARGEPIKAKKKDATNIAQVKKQIRGVKEAQKKALADKDAKQSATLRKQIKRLKRRTRQIALAQKPAAKEAPST